MPLEFTDYCPNCDKRIIIQDDDHFIILLDNGHPVTSCPDCFIPLDVVDGVIVKDDSRLESRLK